MLTDYPFAEQTLERLRRGAAGVYLDDFTAWLAEGGYAQTTIRSYIYAADRFLTWGQETGQVVSALDADSLARYKAHLAATAPAWRRAGEVGNTYCGARRMVVFLRQRGAVSDERSTDPLLLTAFGNWMHQHRGVTQATIATYVPVLRRLLEALGSEPETYTAARAIRRAGIDAPSYGAHLFRHSAATALLHEGLSLQEIGSLLRHRDVDTTALYAKVDVGLLREVALPWPQEAAPC